MTTGPSESTVITSRHKSKKISFYIIKTSIMWKQTEPVMLIICVSLLPSCFYLNKCINVCVRYTLYINVLVFLSLTALRVHRSSRSSSRQTLNTKLAYEAASPTSRTRRIQTCGATSCVGTSRLIASPAWLLRSDGQTFCLTVTFSRGSSECYVLFYG